MRSAKSRRIGFLLSIAALAVVVGCRETKTPPTPFQRPRSLVLITVDTLRADHVSAYGYDRPTTPAIDAFAARSILFERAYSAAASTAPALASLMTSLYPHEHGVLETFGFSLAAEHTTLAERLQAAGFRTAAVLGIGVLMPNRKLDQGFESYSSTAYTNERYWLSAREVTDAALRWLDRNARDSDEPFFLWIHYFEPHQPYEIVPAEFRTRFVATPSAHPQLRGLEPGSRWHSYYKERIDGYDGALAYVDSEIGRLFSALGDSGILDDSMIVLTADHGETLGEHHQHGHVFGLWEPIVRVPLVVSVPGVAPGRVRERVELVDVMPTALAELGVPPKSDRLRGRILPLRRHENGPPWSRFPLGERPVHAETWFEGTRVGMRIEDRFKTVLTQGPAGVSEIRAYDLEADPGEEVDVGGALPDAARREQALREWMRKGLGAPGLIEREPGEAEMLRALGYLE